MLPIPPKQSPLDIPLKRWFPLNLETLLVVILLVLAVVSRFTNLGVRDMSHDEINHDVPTNDLFSGRGYHYDPMSHGPLQFHMMALSEALFGESDFAMRLPAALFSIATIATALLAFRRYLGRWGAIFAGLMFLISPLMLYYGRYARNESYIVIWGLLTLYAILRYLEKGEKGILVLFTLVNAFHFTDKATSYMFAAEQFLFLAAYIVDRFARKEWSNPRRRMFFLVGLIMMIVCASGALGVAMSMKPLTTTLLKAGVGLLVAGSVVSLVWAGYEAVRGLGWEILKSERAMTLLMLLGTFVLPLMGAIPLLLMGYTPLDYSTPGMIRIGVAAGILAAGGIAIGLAWFGRKWLLYAALFFVPFILLYSSFFTNPQGILGGLVGAFTYWSEQQSLGRGGQPLYYYAFLLIPMYEFLPALGTITAAVVASTKKLWQSQSGFPFTRPSSDDKNPSVPVAALLVYWSVSSLAVFTYAGEKMPWLTTHLALPMILAAAWAFGWLVETIPWGRLVTWTVRHYARAVTLAFFALLAVITGRAAYRAAFINYDYPLEYLVYAHAAPDPKELFQQIEELSYRITGGTDLVVAYDNDVRYPYWWYMRHYGSKIDFDVNPTRDIRNALVIAVGDGTLSKVTRIIGDNYYQFDGMRLWWPNEDYKSIKWESIAAERNAALAGEAGTMNIFGYFKYTWPHIKPFFTDAAVRNAVWQIWFNRDYSAWADMRFSESYTLENWGVSNRLYYFIRKDIVAQLWPYGAPAQPLIETVDPYADITIPIIADQVVGSIGSLPGQFQSARAIARATDGSFYVADSLNARIQHLSSDGQVLQVWGSFSDVAQGNAPGGTFNEPWGIAVGPDGSVYVADTWNYRIQKFTADGVFIKMWGSGPAVGTTQFYRPRGLAVDATGRLFVADTGNKRIVIYDSDGNYLSEFGVAGMDLGQLDEPVALAFDVYGNVYITDTWNQRVEVFYPDQSGIFYYGSLEWQVDGWFGNSLNNKPFITVDPQGIVYITDPEQCRVIAYSSIGTPLRLWDGCSTGSFDLPTGITTDGAGGLWVTNSGNGTLVHFIPDIPQDETSPFPTLEIGPLDTTTATDTTLP